jgi:hypothetical protein
MRSVEVRESAGRLVAAGLTVVATLGLVSCSAFEGEPAPDSSVFDEVAACPGELRAVAGFVGVLAGTKPAKSREDYEQLAVDLERRAANAENMPGDLECDPEAGFRELVELEFDLCGARSHEDLTVADSATMTIRAIELACP